MNEDPLADYRSALRRQRLKTLAVLLATVVGLPMGAAFGLVVNRFLFGDYGARSELTFMMSGALSLASLLFAGTRALARLFPA